MATRPMVSTPATLLLPLTPTRVLVDRLQTFITFRTGGIKQRAAHGSVRDRDAHAQFFFTIFLSRAGRSDGQLRASSISRLTTRNLLVVTVL